MFIIIDTHTCTDILWSKSDTIFCSLFTAIRMSMTNQRNVKITHYFSVLVNITNSPVPKFHKEKKLGRYFKRFLSLHICNWRNLWKFDEWQMWWWQVSRGKLSYRYKGNNVNAQGNTFHADSRISIFLSQIWWLLLLLSLFLEYSNPNTKDNMIFKQCIIIYEATHVFVLRQRLRGKKLINCQHKLSRHPTMGWYYCCFWQKVDFWKWEKWHLNFKHSFLYYYNKQHTQCSTHLSLSLQMVC